MRAWNDVCIPDYDLSGRAAAVTGGGSGIGRAAAMALAACGASVMVCDRREEAAQAVCGEILAHGGAAAVSVGDVSVPEDSDRMLRAAADTFGRLDILINNAGVGGQVLPLLEQTAEDFNQVLGVNLTGAFLCAKAAAREMIAAGRGGRIINTSSIAYVEGRGFHGPYGAAKGGLSTLTRTMAAEWAAYGINVNAVAPGLTRTPITRDLAEQPAVLRTFLDKIPLQRMAKPWEIAAMMVFLATDAASFLTGVTIRVDGGATVGG